MHKRVYQSRITSNGELLKSTKRIRIDRKQCKKKTERHVNNVICKYFRSASSSHGNHRICKRINRYIDHLLAPKAYGETDGAQHFRDTTQYKRLGTFMGDQEKQKSIVDMGGKLFRLDQEWVYTNRYKQWMTHVIYGISERTVNAAPKTLLLLKMHSDKYSAHIRHWKRCHPDAKVKLLTLTECCKTCIPRQMNDIRDYFSIRIKTT